MTQLINVEETNVDVVQAVPPTVNVHVGAKPVPLIMTTLPPVVEMVAGARLETVGARYVRDTPAGEAMPQVTRTA